MTPERLQNKYACHTVVVHITQVKMLSFTYNINVYPKLYISSLITFMYSKNIDDINSDYFIHLHIQFELKLNKKLKHLV